MSAARLMVPLQQCGAVTIHAAKSIYKWFHEHLGGSRASLKSKRLIINKHLTLKKKKKVKKNRHAQKMRVHRRPQYSPIPQNDLHPSGVCLFPFLTLHVRQMF